MTFYILASLCIALVLFLLLLALFEPSLKYEARPLDAEVTSPVFLCLLAAAADAQVRKQSRVEVLVEGEVFYEAELKAIAAAKQSVHLEAFLFTPSPIADRFLDALCERAAAGVKVRVVLDWLGSFPCPNRYLDRLRRAGGQVAWYQPLRWYTFKRFNNRTHRELLVIDGRVGFIGGAGIAAHWLGGDKGKRPWRDMMCRVEGDLVAGLQTTFVENWLESTNEILVDATIFPACTDEQNNADGSVKGMVVISTPTAARSSRARVLFQLLVASARKSILINSPYFLPDRSARAELIKAVQRGVSVRVVTPGSSNNHPMTRLASRRIYGDLLRGGVEIHEYQPGMIHKKALVVDTAWSVVGSTNFDTRSFGLNDEVNLAAVDEPLAQRLTADFEHELSHSQKITYEQWQRRPLWERLLAIVGRIMERQE